MDRHMWGTLRTLKKGYTPTPYGRKDSRGKHIPLKQIAEEAAKYLAKHQWGKDAEQKWKEIPTTNIIEEPVHCETGPITREELDAVIAKLKRRKTPGPDAVCVELFKEMDDGNRDTLLNILNEWWSEAVDLP